MIKQTLSQSELTSEERLAVFHYEEQLAHIKEALRLITESTKFLKLSDPSDEDIKMAAKIVGAIAPDRMPRMIDDDSSIHPIWLLTESWILQGKDPLPIHRATLRLLFGEA